MSRLISFANNGKIRIILRIVTQDYKITIIMG